MRRFRPRRPTPALLISILALFIALGGTVYAASKINGKQIKKGSIPGNRLKQHTLTGNQINLAKLGTVPAATNATNAANATNATNANTVGGKTLGYAHVTFAGTTPQIDATESTAGVSVSPSSPPVTGTSCISASFTPKNAVGSVDFVNETSPNANVVLEATPIIDGGHRCAIGQIEVNTSRADAATPGEFQPYFLQFSN